MHQFHSMRYNDEEKKIEDKNSYQRGWKDCLSIDIELKRQILRSFHVGNE